ncbi:MAG: SUF system Fe-S cluster assembly regulator [Kiloniellales bacterium]
MFRLNRLTDYAVVVLAQMALRPGRLVNAAQVAQDTGVPQPTVAKVLNVLAKGGLIASQRGAAGGYTLARPAEEIDVAEIIQAMDGPIALTACVEAATDSCSVESLCPMRGNWERVNTAIRTALSNVTLADMALPFATMPPAAPESPLRAGRQAQA